MTRFIIVYLFLILGILPSLFFLGSACENLYNYFVFGESFLSIIIEMYV